MYKMVVTEPFPRYESKANQTAIDLSADRLGRSAHQSLYTFLGRGSCFSPATCDVLAKATGHIQWVCVRHHAVEVHSAAAGSPRFAWRDGTGILHSNEQERRGHHWGGHLQRHARTSGTLLQQNPMLLLRGAEAQCWRNCGYASLLFHRSRLRQ